MKQFKFILLCFLLLSACMTSCRKTDSSGVLSEGKMEEILYDYHLACGLAMQAEADSVDYYTRLYTETVFAKYGIDAATFDHSMEWYARHTEQLGKIYARLAERMGAPSSGSKPQVPGEAGSQNMQGDTLMLWQAPAHILLHSQGCNRYSFTCKPDTLLHTGDRLQCKFITAWHHRNSQPQALAVLALQYAGDSLVVLQQYLHLSGWQTLTLEVDSSRKVESIKGYVYLASPWSERPCLLTLTNLHLQCVHPSKQQEHKEPAVEMNAQTDTTLQLLPTPQKQIRDSLMRAEQNERSRSHFQ